MEQLHNCRETLQRNVIQTNHKEGHNTQWWHYSISTNRSKGYIKECTWWYTLWHTRNTKKVKVVSLVAQMFEWSRRLYLKMLKRCWYKKKIKLNKADLKPKEKKNCELESTCITHTSKIGIFLILMNSFSGWPEVIKVMNKKATTVKQVRREVFSRHGVSLQ